MAAANNSEELFELPAFKSFTKLHNLSDQELCHLADTWYALKTEKDRLLLKFKIFPALAQEYLEHQPRRLIPQGYCQTADLVPSKESGYAQISVANINKFTTLGKMLGCAAGLYIDEVLGRNTGGRTEVSHRYHNPLCVIPAHILLESAVRNNGRKYCMAFVRCQDSRLLPQVPSDVLWKVKWTES